MDIPITNKQPNTISSILFWLYIYFIFDFFLHLSARIPAYGVIRPTLLLIVLITVLLFFQKEKFKGVWNEPTFRALKWLVLFILLTLPLVTWPGSVLANNLPLFIKAIVFFFFTALVVDTEKRLRIFLLVFIGCQLFRVFEPLSLYLTDGYLGGGTYLGDGEFAGRLSGAPDDVVNPNGLGFIIVTIIPYLYYLVWGSASKFNKIVFISVLPLLLYALILTMSRGAFLALVVVVWIIFKESKHKILMVLVVALSLVGIWNNLSYEHKDRYSSLFGSSSKQSATAQGRLRGMLVEFEISLERPFVGHGLGTMSEAKVHSGHRRQAAHNLYAEILVELGLLGFIIFLKFLHAIYKQYSENRKIIEVAFLGNRSAFEYRLNKAFVAVFWMFVVYSVNYFGLSVYYWYLFGGLTVAFTRTCINKNQPNEAPSPIGESNKF